ncbi:hypothetical protein SAICODRAFT_66112 [Saitoella complicata NRRL Y-17804]|uniref:Uncharacterized protein n=1 Tax=Saitoella complicata (strain BCRC 22490 / CBS 7301 / JCM 7358 / NBRC 10748 / NRRL Y-17804) TaxID=698492 RepID=A0A0E9NLB8_SAICN|nr:uncharacterized protein SAICODRAFT_66112 [Saitoella complicata NRRL Y-17804]ODQ52498.1 hypothetical protein SAICODRAFT_66112 [Saitoella complicata NRRL Y-17804]GAO50466.1 hypothetical protein G7K_4590-t1 [Saitoella complicata NRRL Y-17804]
MKAFVKTFQRKKKPDPIVVKPRKPIEEDESQTGTPVSATLTGPAQPSTFVTPSAITREPEQPQHIAAEPPRITGAPPQLVVTPLENPPTEQEIRAAFVNFPTSTPTYGEPPASARSTNAFRLVPPPMRSPPLPPAQSAQLEDEKGVIRDSWLAPFPMPPVRRDEDAELSDVAEDMEDEDDELRSVGAAKVGLGLDLGIIEEDEGVRSPSMPPPAPPVHGEVYLGEEELATQHVYEETKTPQLASSKFGTFRNSPTRSPRAGSILRRARTVMHRRQESLGTNGTPNPQSDDDVTPTPNKFAWDFDHRLSLGLSSMGHFQPPQEEDPVTPVVQPKSLNDPLPTPPPSGSSWAKDALATEDVPPPPPPHLLPVPPPHAERPRPGTPNGAWTPTTPYAASSNLGPSTPQLPTTPAIPLPAPHLTLPSPHVSSPATFRSASPVSSFGTTQSSPILPANLTRTPLEPPKLPDFNFGDALVDESPSKVVAGYMGGMAGSPVKFTFPPRPEASPLRAPPPTMAPLRRPPSPPVSHNEVPSQLAPQEEAIEPSLSGVEDFPERSVTPTPTSGNGVRTGEPLLTPTLLDTVFHESSSPIVGGYNAQSMKIAIQADVYLWEDENWQDLVEGAKCILTTFPEDRYCLLQINFPAVQAADDLVLGEEELVALAVDSETTLQRNEEKPQHLIIGFALDRTQREYYRFKVEAVEQADALYNAVYDSISQAGSNDAPIPVEAASPEAGEVLVKDAKVKLFARIEANNWRQIGNGSAKLTISSAKQAAPVLGHGVGMTQSVSTNSISSFMNSHSGRSKGPSKRVVLTVGKGKKEQQLVDTYVNERDCEKMGKFGIAVRVHGVGVYLLQFKSDKEQGRVFDTLRSSN